MRSHFNDCLEAHRLTRFPKSGLINISPVLINITKNLNNTQKLSTPKKASFSSSNKQIPLSHASINLQNCFSLITNISSSNITTHKNLRTSAPSKGPSYKTRDNQQQNSTSFNGTSNTKPSPSKSGSFSTLCQSSKITVSTSKQINPTSSNNLVLNLSARG